jgi:hypothetical protein
MSVSFKAETGAYRASDGNTTFSLNLPSGLAVGDPLFLFIASASTGLSVTTPTGWTSLGSANIGTGSWVLLRRNGGWQTADGTSRSITVAVAQNLTYTSFGLDGTLYDPDTMTVGTVTTRSASGTTCTAVSAGSGAAMLVLSAEKASSHTGAPDAPSVSPTTTQGAWRASSVASSASCYGGIYEGTPGTRTITYSTASSNGAAFQIALTAAAGTNTAPTANAGTDQTGIEPYATVTLDGSGSFDPDSGDSITYDWTQTAGTTVTPTGATTSSPTFTAPPTIDGDTLTFQLTVTDESSATDTDTVDITVLPHTIWRKGSDSALHPIRVTKNS